MVLKEEQEEQLYGALSVCAILVSGDLTQLSVYLIPVEYTIQFHIQVSISQ